MRGVNSSWYRARWADCKSLAEHASDSQSKAVLEEMAASWLRLAELVEGLEARVPPPSPEPPRSGPAAQGHLDQTSATDD